MEIVVVKSKKSGDRSRIKEVLLVVLKRMSVTVVVTLKNRKLISALVTEAAEIKRLLLLQVAVGQIKRD